MKEKKKKNVVQMTVSEDEIYPIKVASTLGKFASVSDYIRSLVTVDIIAKKKASPYPSTFGITEDQWLNLNDFERDKYMSQIGPVLPNSMDEFLREKRFGPSPMDVGFKQELDKEIFGD